MDTQVQPVLNEIGGIPHTSNIGPNRGGFGPSHWNAKSGTVAVQLLAGMTSGDTKAHTVRASTVT